MNIRNEHNTRARTAAAAAATLTLGAGLLLALTPGAARAQDGGAGSGSANTAGATRGRVLPPVSLDLRDAPIRQALEQLFQNAKVDFSLDNAVAGFVTLKVTDQPFENALRLILRSGSVPLNFSVENGVYVVKPRPLAPPPVAEYGAAAPAMAAAGRRSGPQFEVIQLTYIDAFDLQQLLGVTILPTGARFGNAGGGFAGGGFGGGGFGGPQLGGGFGGGFGGGVGGAFGGSGTGMAGFGSGGVGGGNGAQNGQGGGPGGNAGGGNASGGGIGRLGSSPLFPNLDLFSNQAGDALLAVPVPQP